MISLRSLLIALLLCLAATVFAQDVELTEIEPTTYFTIATAKVRECPRTSCKIVMTLKKGTEVTVDATAIGQTVQNRNSEWYHIVIDGKEGFIYSGTTSGKDEVYIPPSTTTSTTTTTTQSSDPAATPAPGDPVLPVVVAPTPVPANTGRPKNCAEAVAWGLTAEQAAQWPHLDRDKDGVACYGD